MNIPKVLGTAFFYRTTLVAAFEFCFSIRKEFLKKNVKLFNVQLQEPTSRLTSTRGFVFHAKFAEFYYQKILKQEVNDDLSVCLDEGSPRGLSITGNIKM